MWVDDEETVEVEFDELVRQSEKAFLVSIDGEESWVAKSKTENSHELEKQLSLPPDDRSVFTIIVPRWLARDNGWWDD
jgi:hypothetical protein